MKEEQGRLAWLGLDPAILTTQYYTISVYLLYSAARRKKEELAAFAEKMGYENLEDFVEGVAGGLKYQLGLLEH